MEGAGGQEEVATLSEIGDSLLASGDLEGGLEAYDALLAIDPESKVGLLGSASAFGTLGAFEEAYRYLDLAAAVMPEDPDVWGTAASVALTAGDAPTAHEAAARRVELGDGGMDALLDLAAAAFYSLDQDATADAVDAALAVDPEDDEARAWWELFEGLSGEHDFLVQVARAHVREGRLVQGLEVFDRALDVGDSYEARLYTGRALLEAGEPASAMEQFDAAEDFADGDPAALLGLGEAAAELGRTDVAHWAGERLLEDHPDLPEALALLEWADGTDAGTWEGPAEGPAGAPESAPVPEERAAFCFQCGTRFLDDADFCVRCGAGRL